MGNTLSDPLPICCSSSSSKQKVTQPDSGSACSRQGDRSTALALARQLERARQHQQGPANRKRCTKLASRLPVTVQERAGLKPVSCRERMRGALPEPIGCDLCHTQHRTPPPTASLQEEYIKEEQRSLKRELMRAQEEVKRIQAVPLVIGQFLVSTVADQCLATVDV